jgi:hypothetical protein
MSESRNANPRRLQSETTFSCSEACAEEEEEEEEEEENSRRKATRIFSPSRFFCSDYLGC